jgi:hypothetical protein
MTAAAIVSASTSIHAMDAAIAVRRTRFKDTHDFFAQANKILDETIGYGKGKELSEVDEDGPELGWQDPRKGKVCAQTERCQVVLRPTATLQNPQSRDVGGLGSAPEFGARHQSASRDMAR